MNFNLDGDQTGLQGLAADLLSKEARTERLEAHEKSGAAYDTALWKAFAQAGLLGATLPESVGGAGLGAIEYAIILRELGRHVAPIPVFASLTAAAAIVAHGSEAQIAALAPLVDGDILLTVAPRSLGAITAEDGRLTGVATFVPYATEASVILVAAGADVYLVKPADAQITPQPSATSEPLSRVELDGTPGELLAGAGDTLRDHVTAGSLAITSGVIDGALRLTTDYVKTREQFGRKLAEFQAVTMQIGDVYIAKVALDVALWAGVWRLANGLPDTGEVLAVGALNATDGVVKALYTCQHLHGGMGMDVTYPLHRYFAWTKHFSHVLGGVQTQLDALGDHVRTPPAVYETTPVTDGLLIDLTDEQKALRAELRTYFRNCLTDADRARIAGDPFGTKYMEHCKRLGRDGMLGVNWPAEYGGRGFGPMEQQIFANEIARAEVPYPIITLNSVAPTILQYGTAEQKAFFLPRILAGECHFAIGYTEPGAGTDLASLRTTAVLDGDHYVCNGQKVFTSGGHYSDYVWLAARTSDEGAKHKGITMLIADCKDPGYSWTPIVTMDGRHHTNASYYQDVRVPVDMVIGEVNKGWNLIVNQLNHERVTLGPAGNIGHHFDRFERWARTTGAINEPEVARAVGLVHAYLRTNEFLNWQVAANMDKGWLGAADASATKIYGSERMQDVGRIMGDTLARFGDPGDPDTAHFMDLLDHAVKGAVVLTFGGGVNEIQRELIAMIGLGLPRAPR
jgi:alkylation response protein AidB-like acyl-CoA dehydrogenase